MADEKADYSRQDIGMIAVCFRSVEAFLKARLAPGMDNEARLTVTPKDYHFREVWHAANGVAELPLYLDEGAWLHSEAVVMELRSVVSRLTGIEEFMISVRPNSEMKRFGLHLGLDPESAIISVQPLPEAVAFAILAISEAIDCLAGLDRGDAEALRCLACADAFTRHDGLARWSSSTRIGF